MCVMRATSSSLFLIFGASLLDAVWLCCISHEVDLNGSVGKAHADCHGVSLNTADSNDKRRALSPCVELRAGVVEVRFNYVELYTTVL